MTELFLIFSYLTLIAVANAKQYKRMLALNILSCWLCGVYLCLTMAYVGAAVSTIAGFASLIQFYLPEKQSEKIKSTRNGIASAFVILVVSILYSRPSDLFPCFAFTLNRVSEAQENPRLIRFSLMIGGLCWAAYAFYNGLYFFVAVEILTVVFISLVTMRREVSSDRSESFILTGLPLKNADNRYNDW